MRRGPQEVEKERSEKLRLQWRQRKRRKRCRSLGRTKELRGAKRQVGLGRWKAQRDLES